MILEEREIWINQFVEAIRIQYQQIYGEAMSKTTAQLFAEESIYLFDEGFDATSSARKVLDLM
jgi:hypothetical protein